VPDRLVLVETQHDDVRRHHRVELFPFILGLARQLGWHAEWWVVAVPVGFMHVGGRYVFDLPPDGRRLLREALGAAAPDVALFHDRPAPGLLADLQPASPATRFLDLTRLRRDPGPGHVPLPAAALPRAPGCVDATLTVAEIVGFLEGDEPRVGGSGGVLLLDAASPTFDRRLLGDGPPTGQRQPPTRLALMAHCAYRRPVRHNPAYRGLGSTAVAQHLGCAFCDAPHADGPRFATAPVELALRQIEAHQRAVTTAGPQAEPLEYLFEDTPLSDDLPGFLAAVLERELLPSTFTTMTRVDVLLGMRDSLDGLLPRLTAAGHRLRILSIGAESFSAAENARFNKGLDAAQIWACHGMIRDLEARFPGTFACPDLGYFATILFTPWTTPADLSENVAAARTLGAPWLNRAIGSRLQLWEGLPITDLARRDGLAVDAPAGSVAEVEAICHSSPDQREVPWRFADPRTALLHRVLIRLEPIPCQARLHADDPLLAEIAARRARLRGEVGRDYVGVVARLVAAAEPLDGEADVSQLLDAAFADAVEALPEPELATPPEPEPPASPAGVGGGEIRFVIDGRPEGEYRFHVVRHREGQPYFRRLGDVALYYSHARMTPRATAFARVLLAVMRRIGAPPASAEDVQRWRAEASGALAGSGLAGRFTWTVEWVPDAAPPAGGGPSGHGIGRSSSRPKRST
jgi:hypothetical protein